ncbi:MAG: divergent polysaccharide deacetylase family protein [Alphaproteobacteria bacterium]|nr:divergent polysaccharide deacetylase family protein [Alphaproteobacteria bacterium]
MESDDLNAPLGQTKRRRRPLAPAAIPWTIAAVLASFSSVFLGWALLVKDPLGGEPVVIVATDDKTAPKSQDAGSSGGDGAIAKPPEPDSAAPSATSAQPRSDGGRTVTIIDGSSGKRQDVQLSPNSEPAADATVDRLIESTRHGPIPKIGRDGARPAEVHSQKALETAAKGDLPRIAIVVGGLGISASTTSEALAKLPGPITLAFLPYGADLDRLSARARGEGHEVLLQAPMEPVDYPENDPGPQTLLTTLSTDQNIDRLHWIMSRFRGYVGIAGFMGTRFTASDAALAPILRETAKRGLLYLEDGSSVRSLASQIAGANNMGFAKADIVLDATPTGIEIDRALGRLEQIARERGAAIGMANALPVTIDRLAAWAKTAGQRGVVLVPLTAIALKPKST